MTAIRGTLFILLLFAMSAAAQPGHLFIDSKPAGASIELDGLLIDTVTTPTILTLQPGHYSVTVSKGYFDPVTLDVNILAGQYVRRMVEFEPTSGVRSLSPSEVARYGNFARLTVITDLPGAEVWIDGVKVALETPLQLVSLMPGQHHVGVAYDTIAFDSMLTLPGGQETKLYVALAKLAQAPQQPPSATVPDDSVTLHITFDVPGCDYRIPDAPGQPTVIRGADPSLTLAASADTLQLSGTDIAATKLDYDHHGVLRKWSMPDTTVHTSFRINKRDSVLVGVTVFASEKRKFQAKNELTPVRKLYPIHGWFNRGEDIAVDIRIEPSGVVHFRYY